MAHVKKHHAPPPPPVAAISAQPAINGKEKQDRSSSQGQGRELELSVVLPGGKLSSITVDRSTAMSDVLVLIAQKHKLTPTEHVLSVLSEETGHSLSFTALQPIGALQVKRVFLLSKKTPKKEEPTGTVTLTVVLPKGSKAAYEFVNKTSIAHAYRVVCAERALDPSVHTILLPGAESAQSPTELTHTTLAESGIGGFSILPLKAPVRYQSMMDVSSQGTHSNGLQRELSNSEKKSSRSGSGFWALFKRKKKPKEQPQGNAKAATDGLDEEPAAKVSPQQPPPPPEYSTALPEAVSTTVKSAKPQASVKPQVQATVARDTGTGDATAPDVYSKEAIELQQTPPKKKYHAPQPPSLRSASSTSSGGGSSTGTGATTAPLQADWTAASAVSTSAVASVGQPPETRAQIRAAAHPAAGEQLNGHAAQVGGAHADGAALLQSPPSAATGSSTASVAAAAAAPGHLLRQATDDSQPSLLAHGAADAAAGIDTRVAGGAARLPRPLSAAAATAGGHGKKNRAPPPPLADRDSEAPRSASRNSEASIDTIADVTRSFEQAIVEGQNALKEEWQDLQPKIAEFVASIDVLTSDLHSVGSGSASSGARGELSGRVSASVPANVGAVPAQSKAAPRLPTPPCDYHTPPEDEQPHAPQKPPRLPSLVFLTDDCNSDGEALPPPPVVSHINEGGVSGSGADARASVSSMKLAVAAADDGDRVDGDRFAGPRPPLQAIAYEASGTDLIVGGSASTVPSHPFASEGVWQELGDRRAPPIGTDAQRLLHTLATATLSPHDDAGGSVRGVKGRVRAARSRLLEADGDDGIDHDDNNDSMTAREPASVPPQHAFTAPPASNTATFLPAADADGGIVSAKPETGGATSASNRQSMQGGADGPAVAGSASVVVGSAAATVTIPTTDVAASWLPAAPTSSVSSAASSAGAGAVLVTPATSSSGATVIVVRARRAVVSPSGQPVSAQGIGESEPRRSLVEPAALTTSSTAAGTASATTAVAIQRPDLRAVPEPARATGRTDDAADPEDQIDVRLRTVAGRSAISSSTTQLFSRRGPPPSSVAGEPSAAAASAPSTGRRLSLRPAADVASPQQQQPGSAELDGGNVAAAAGAGSGGVLLTVAVEQPKSLPPSAHEDDRAGPPRRAAMLPARGSSSGQLATGAGGAEPSSASSHADASRFGPAKGTGDSSAVGKPPAVGPAEKPLLCVVPSSSSSTQLDSIADAATAGNAAASSFQPTAAANEWPSADSAGSAAVPPAAAAAAAAATALRSSVADAVEEVLVVTRARTVSMDPSPAAGHQPLMPGHGDGGSGNVASGSGTPAALTTAATDVGMPTRAHVAASGGQPKKTIFSLLSSLDASKPPAVKRRSNTLPPTSSEPTAGDDGPGYPDFQAAARRAAAVPGAELTVASSGGSGGPASSASAGRPAASAAVTVTPTSKPAPLQARLYTPRPFAARPWSTAGEAHGQPIAGAGTAAAAPEPAPATTASDVDAAMPGEKRQQQQHAFRLSLTTSSAADVEARRKQELVRRYEDLQKEVAAWRGQLLENEAVLKDAEQPTTALSAAATAAPPVKPSASAFGPLLEQHRQAAASSTADSRSPTKKQPPVVLPATGSRLGALRQTNGDSQVTLESMVAQMAQVKLKPAPDRAAKQPPQQQQPSSSREQLMQSIRDRGVRLNMVDEGEAEVDVPQQEKVEMRGGAPATATKEKAAVPTNAVPQQMSRAELPPPPPPPPLPLLQQPQVAAKSARQNVTVLKSPSQTLDPREELMIAIRSFGGSLKLRTATSSPGNTPR